MPIYEFEWGHHTDERFLMEIEADKKTVQKLLDEYRASDPEGYNNTDWCDFLEQKGIKARGLPPEATFYF